MVSFQLIFQWAYAHRSPNSISLSTVALRFVVVRIVLWFGWWSRRKHERFAGLTSVGDVSQGEAKIRALGQHIVQERSALIFAVVGNGINYLRLALANIPQGFAVKGIEGNRVQVLRDQIGKTRRPASF